MNNRKFQIKGERLHRALSAVLTARCNEAARPAINCVLVDVEKGKLRLVATDSYRMAIADVNLADKLEDSGKWTLQGDLKPLLAALKRSGDEYLTVDATGDTMVIETSAGTLIESMGDGDNFPDYRQLIPGDNKLEGEVAYNPRFLSDIGKAAMTFNGETARNCTTPVRLTPDSSKPGVFVTHNIHDTLIQLLMPVRVA